MTSNIFEPVFGGGSAGGGSFVVTKLTVISKVTDFPAATAGDWIKVTTSDGNPAWIGGAAGIGRNVVDGQLLYCWHTTIAGTEAAVGAYWYHGPRVINMPDGYRGIQWAINTVNPTQTDGLFPKVDGAYMTVGGVIKKIDDTSRYYGGVFDGGGSAIAANKKVYIRIPKGCTIVSAWVMADVSGIISIEVWKDIFANFPPTIADKISASVPIALASAQTATIDVSTWGNKTCAAGDVICLNVSVLATNITWCSAGVEVA